MPFPEKVNRYRIYEGEDDKKFCEMDFYIGELSGEKFGKWAEEKRLGCRAAMEQFDFKLTGAIDKTLHRRLKVALSVPLQEEALKMIQATDAKTIFPPVKHPFSPPDGLVRVRGGAARVVGGDGRGGGFAV